MHAYVHSINTNKCLHTYIHAIFACKHLFMCKYIVLIQTCAYVHTYMRVKIHSCKYILECIHKFIYTYARTYIHGAKIPNKCTPNKCTYKKLKYRWAESHTRNQCYSLLPEVSCGNANTRLITRVNGSCHTQTNHVHLCAGVWMGDVMQNKITCSSVQVFFGIVQNHAFLNLICLYYCTPSFLARLERVRVISRIYIQMLDHTRTPTYACTCTRAHKCAHTCMHISLFTNHKHIHLCIHKNTRAQTHVRMHLHTCT